MTSKEFRNDPLFLRNSFVSQGKLGIPIIKKQNVDWNNIDLISINDTRLRENKANKKRGVHFFVDDYRFENTYRRPSTLINRLKQYKFVLSPDFSLYSEMQPWRQIESIAHSRWVGAYWQKHGLIVVPTVSWSAGSSFEFCFDGIEKGSVVAIGMPGSKESMVRFMRGYNAMIDKIEPSSIIVFGSPFAQMQGNLVTVDYIESKRRDE